MSTTLQQAALVTRDARESLQDQKTLVDSVTQKIRLAERQTVGVAIGRQQGEDPVKVLRDAVESLQSPDLEAAVSQARAKMQSALNMHLGLQQV